MAYRYQQHISSEPFKELAYRALKAMPSEMRSTLTHEENKIFQSEYFIKKFCAEERIDHIMYLMAKVGYSWTFSIEKDHWATEMVEFNTKDQSEYPQKRVDITEATAREGLCVISSRDVMFLSHMVAQNTSTKVYQISEFSKDLAAKGRDFGQLKKWEQDIAKHEQAHMLWNDVVLEQLNSFEYAQHTLGLDADELRILCALFKKRNSAIRMKDISTLTKSKGRKMYFRKQLEQLIKEGLVTSDVKTTVRTWPSTGFFMISTKGIGKIMEYQKYVYKNAFGAGKE